MLSKELLGMRQELEGETVDVFELARVHKQLVGNVLATLQGP